MLVIKLYKINLCNELKNFLEIENFEVLNNIFKKTIFTFTKTNKFVNNTDDLSLIKIEIYR